MDLITWMAIAICGPGALFVFAWFLRDMLHLRRQHREPAPPAED